MKTPSTDWYAHGVDKGWIETYEQEMLRFLEGETGKLADEIRLCIVFVSLFVKAGHVCLPLDLSPKEWARQLDLQLAEQNLLQEKTIHPETILHEGLIGRPGGKGNTPFILEGNRLMINRYRKYELTVAQKLLKFSSNNYKISFTEKDRTILDLLFPAAETDRTDWQKVAAGLSLFKHLLLISGGPGTGKTTTVAKILALLLQVEEKPLRIALAAPTGKAAARMGDAIHSGIQSLGLAEEYCKWIPENAKTVHRLLRGYHDTGLLPSAHPKLLPYDLIVIDEASMIDLTLMHRLLTHVHKDTRLILLGDKNQLSSVEAGAVLADICRKQENKFTLATIKQLQMLGLNDSFREGLQSSLDDAIVYLERSWRFDETGGIGKLAAAIKAGPSKSVQGEGQPDLFHSRKSGMDSESLFNAGGSSGTRHLSFSFSQEELSSLMESITGRIEQARHQSQSASQLLEIMDEQVWLTVLRHGTYGSVQLNRLAEQLLEKKRIIQFSDGWYHGRPVIVTQNDYHLGIFNGDIGVCTLDESRTPWVHFPDGEGIVRTIQAYQLYHVEPAYFITVHKSQGSEFNRVNLLLPPENTPVLTKELLYTAVTRAKKECVVVGDLELFKKGMEKTAVRFTGLAERLEKMQKSSQQ